jgi:hypothetical protein
MARVGSGHSKPGHSHISGRDAINGVGGWGHRSEILGCGWLEFINAATFMIASTRRPGVLLGFVP